MTEFDLAQIVGAVQADGARSSWAIEEIGRHIAALEAAHDKRVAELLDANNYEVERRRKVERELAELRYHHNPGPWSPKNIGSSGTPEPLCHAGPEPILPREAS